jgi:hypothetical protein
MRVLIQHEGMSLRDLSKELGLAQSTVSGIARQFGWEPYDCGGIVSARAIEPLCMLWCLPGFLRNDWQRAFKILTK